MAPGELEDLPEPPPAAPGELTAQPGPRNTWSWSPPPAGGRMGGCETTPPDSRTDHRKPAPPSGRLIHGKPQSGRLSSLAIIGRRSPASSSSVLCVMNAKEGTCRNPFRSGAVQEMEEDG